MPSCNDVSGIALIWTVKGDNLETARVLTADDMKALFRKIEE